jgi:hypothetical protein
MAAELARVEGRAARWSFAAGCARVALFPPRRRAPVLAAAAGTALAAGLAALAAARAVPALQVFAVAFVALVGAWTTLAAARPPRGRAAAPGRLIAGAGLIGVGTCVALTADLLATAPAPAHALPPREALLLAGGLAAGLWLALRPPRSLTTSRLARVVGAGTALVLGLGFVAAARAFIHTTAGVALYLLVVPPALCFAGGALAAGVGRSFRAGVQAAVWAALLGALLVFALWVPEGVYRYGIDAGQLLDGEGGLPVAANLHMATWWSLVLLPVWGLPFGVFGAAAVGAAAAGGARRRRRRRRARALRDPGPGPADPTFSR